MQLLRSSTSNRTGGRDRTRATGGAALARMLAWSLLAIALTIRTAAGGPVQVTTLSFVEQDGQTRIVLESDQMLAFSARAAAEPWRLVLDLPEALWNLHRAAMAAPRGLARGHRFGRPGDGRSQLVVDIREPFRIVRTEHSGTDRAASPHRLTVDLEPAPAELALQLRAPPMPVPRPRADAAKPAMAVRLPVVVIDAGHGGADPGAVGVNGLKEKTLTLTMARELRKGIEATGRYRVAMTRAADEYVPLRERIARAREAKGDLFISLHADALGRSTTRGASVYTLSEKASDAEAEQLAAKENKADIIAGADLGEHDAVVASILIDLAQRGTTNKSVSFADVVSDEMAAVTPLLRRHRRFAGFAVLKAPDIPSVLVELGYLSNPTDARNLASKGHRQRLVRAIVRAVDRHFSAGRS